MGGSITFKWTNVSCSIICKSLKMDLKFDVLCLVQKFISIQYESKPNLFKHFIFILQKTVYGANVVIFEGILAFSNKELTEVSVLLK